MSSPGDGASGYQQYMAGMAAQHMTQYAPPVPVPLPLPLPLLLAESPTVAPVVLPPLAPELPHIQPRAASRRVTISSDIAAAGNGREIRVIVRTLDESAALQDSRSGTILGVSKAGDVLISYTDAGGSLTVDTVKSTLVPRSTLKQVVSADKRMGAAQLPAVVRHFYPSDFAPCQITSATGQTSGYIGITGPLMGVACDSTVLNRIAVTVIYWQVKGGDYKFRINTEPLIRDVRSTIFPASSISVLSELRGRVRASNSFAIAACLNEGCARRMFGNRFETVKGTSKLIAFLMSDANFDVPSGLSTTRALLGCVTHAEKGTFFVCTNQVTIPWGEATKCCCHVKFPNGTSDELKQKFTDRPRCTGGKKRKRAY